MVVLYVIFMGDVFLKGRIRSIVGLREGDGVECNIMEN
jgi:hypothetical protein